MPDDVQKKCEKLSSAVKGYLTRRLFRTEKVQSIIKTIWVIVTHLALYFCYQLYLKASVRQYHKSSDISVHIVLYTCRAICFLNAIFVRLVDHGS